MLVISGGLQLDHFRSDDNILGGFTYQAESLLKKYIQNRWSGLFQLSYISLAQNCLEQGVQNLQNLTI